MPKYKLLGFRDQGLEKTTNHYSKKSFAHPLTPNPPSPGFTLIEVLVSIAIVALASAIAIPNLRGFSSDHDLDNQSSDFKNLIRTAQSSSNSNIKCSNGQTSTSWKVRITPTNFQLISTCMGSTTETWSTQNLNTYIAIASTSCSALPVDIIFSSNQTSFVCTSGTVGTTFNLTLKNQRNNNQKQVNISLGGAVSD